MDQKVRVLYLCGPGDVIGTYCHWLRGRLDPSQVAQTYSAQFFDVCCELGARARLIAQRPNDASFRAGVVSIDYRPIPMQDRSGVLYHVGQLLYGLRLLLSALVFRADVVVIAAGTHWFMAAPLVWLGMGVVPSLHCAFWPTGHRPRNPVQRLIQLLNGWFWRRLATATIAVSPECERQIREIAGRVKGPIYQARAQYSRESFDLLPAPVFDGRPFRLMYAGRLERAKGVLDLLEVAEQLERIDPRGFVLELCGSGGAEKEVRGEITRRGLESAVTLIGQLDRDAMKQAFARSHAVIVPTTAAFAEGLNKVAIEAILASRPVITTRFAHVLDVLGSAVVEVPRCSADAYVEAIVALARNREVYEYKRAACAAVKEQFYDRSHSWGAALQQILRALKEPRCPRQRSLY